MMKMLLVILNLFLGISVLTGGLVLCKKASRNAKPAFTVKKRSKGKKIPSPVSAGKQTAAGTIKTPDREDLIKNIVQNNIFDQERVPNAGMFLNARVELTLVGTFKAGKHSGAVILQKSNARQMPAFTQMFGGTSPMGRRMGIGRGNPMMMNRQQGGAAPFRTMTGNAGRQPEQRRQQGGSVRIHAVRNAQGAVIPGTANAQLSNNTKVTYKQYVRLGETLANGYKLVEIHRNSVTLMRGSDKLELELVDASKNAPKRAGRPRRVNQNQVMQQMMNTMQNMQRMQNMQNWRMMQSMRQMNNQNRSQGTAPRRR